MKRKIIKDQKNGKYLSLLRRFLALMLSSVETVKETILLITIGIYSSTITLISSNILTRLLSMITGSSSSSQ